MANYNYALAFVEFCKGTSIDDISNALQIPLKTLQTHARQNGWQKLANMLGEHVPQSATPPKVEHEIERIQENREENLKKIRKLMEDLDKIVDHLLAGTLRIQKVLSNGKIVEAEPSIADRVAVANYAKILTELSYRALNDAPLARDREAAPAQAALVQIHLPAAVALPRHLRGESGTQTLTSPSGESKVIPVTLSPADEPTPPLSSESV